jgi:hypothetical protein
MCHKQYETTLDTSQRLPAVFTTDDAILHNQGKWIRKHTRHFEAYPMLLPVDFRLFRIPFKLNDRNKMLLHFCCYFKASWD